MKQQLPRLYLISDRRQVPAGKDLYSVAAELLQTGIKMFQLREKDLPAAQLYPLALNLRQLTRQHNCLFLINDRIDLALAVDADGVQLGNHSMPTAVARQLLGSDRLIGVSTHYVNEIFAAAQAGADFVTYGPIYPTPSKAAYGDPVGIDNLYSACRAARLPVFALGGINPDNLEQTLQAGPHGTAMISALLASSCPTETAREMLRATTEIPL
jgi:thiamine-phosphate pyrophosphorylase